MPVGFGFRVFGGFAWQLWFPAGVGCCLHLRGWFGRVAGCVSCGRCSGSYSLWISCVCWCVVSLGWGLRLLWVFGLVLGVGFVGAWFWCCSWLGCFDFDVVFVFGFYVLWFLWLFVDRFSWLLSIVVCWYGI